MDRCHMTIIRPSRSTGLALLTALVVLLSPAGGDKTNQRVCIEGDNCVLDTLGFEAVNQLHVLIDDDHNGNLDRSESNEYFRDELKHDDGAARQEHFHGNDDLISINDLWGLWTVSEVYNWTVDDVICWLKDDVNLPKYTESFRINEVDGHILPRIAVNSQYVTTILGIKNPIHRQKLSVKATDLVLFGYKKRGHNWLIDLLLVSLMVVSLAVAWLACRDKRASEKHVRRVMAELDSLQRSEDTLITLQRDYEHTKREHQETTQAKQHLEKKLADEVTASMVEAERLRTTREATEEEIQRLKLAELELIQVRHALGEAERRVDQMESELPPLIELQQWLQLTFEVESQYYEMKKQAAEQHLRIAREMCERIRKKRSGILGPLRVAHGTSMDDTDQSISQARGALEEVRLYFMERTQRWQELERICGFDIIQNPGLHVLETTLRGVGGTYIAGSGMATSPSVSAFSGVSSIPLDNEIDENLSPAQLATGAQQQAGGTLDHSHDKRRSLAESYGAQRAVTRHAKTVPHALNRADTSSSITSMASDDSSHGNGSVCSGSVTDLVKFRLGEPSSSPKGSPKLSHVPYSKSKSLETSSKSVRPKSLPTSLSESALSNLPGHTAAPVTSRRTTQKAQESPSVIEEESGHDSSQSTDSTESSPNGKEKKKTTLKTLFKSKKKKDL